MDIVLGVATMNMKMNDPCTLLDRGKAAEPLLRAQSLPPCSTMRIMSTVTEPTRKTQNLFTRYARRCGGLPCLVVPSLLAELRHTLLLLLLMAHPLLIVEALLALELEQLRLLVCQRECPMVCPLRLPQLWRIKPLLIALPRTTTRRLPADLPAIETLSITATLLTMDDTIPRIVLNIPRKKKTMGKLTPNFSRYNANILLTAWTSRSWHRVQRPILFIILKLAESPVGEAAAAPKSLPTEDVRWRVLALGIAST
jgi:hypothetical protein